MVGVDFCFYFFFSRLVLFCFLVSWFFFGVFSFFVCFAVFWFMHLCILLCFVWPLFSFLVRFLSNGFKALFGWRCVSVLNFMFCYLFLLLIGFWVVSFAAVCLICFWSVDYFLMWPLVVCEFVMWWFVLFCSLFVLALFCRLTVLLFLKCVLVFVCLGFVLPLRCFCLLIGHCGLVSPVFGRFFFYWLVFCLVFSSSMFFLDFVGFCFVSFLCFFSLFFQLAAK